MVAERALELQQAVAGIGGGIALEAADAGGAAPVDGIGACSGFAGERLGHLRIVEIDLHACGGDVLLRHSRVPADGRHGHLAGHALVDPAALATAFLS